MGTVRAARRGDVLMDGAGFAATFSSPPGAGDARERGGPKSNFLATPSVRNVLGAVVCAPKSTSGLRMRAEGKARPPWASMRRLAGEIIVVEPGESGRFCAVRDWSSSDGKIKRSRGSSSKGSRVDMACSGGGR